MKTKLTAKAIKGVSGCRIDWCWPSGRVSFVRGRFLDRPVLKCDFSELDGGCLNLPPLPTLPFTNLWNTRDLQSSQKPICATTRTRG